MAQGTAASRPDHGDQDIARSVVMAALGQSEESPVEDDDAGDTNATSTAADDVEDSDESADNPEEAEEGAESEDEEPAEEVEAKGEDDSPFTAADKAAIAADPKLAKLAKGLQKSYTERMQELGEVKKFREQLKGDPKSVLQRIAEANGLKVSFEGQAAAAAPVIPAAPPQVPEVLSTVAAGVRAKWVPIIGEEATDQLLSGMQEIVTAATGAAVGPLVQANTAREQAAVQAQVNADLERFKAEHTDWAQHEQAMTELAGKIVPQGMSTYEFAKFLYSNVTRGQQIAKAKVEASAKVAAKVKRAATDAEPAPRTRVPSKGVKEAPRKYTAEDAVRAALAEQGYSA